MIKLLLSACVISLAFSTPIAVFHGMGDACANSGMKKFTQQLGALLGVYSACIEIGNGSLTSIGMDFKKQAAQACENVKANPQLQGQTINVVGLSQGALLARHIAEECDFGGSVLKVLSIGGPNMGVTAFPHCADGGFTCYPVNTLTKSMVYTDYIQSMVGPAGYFRDVTRLDKYIAKSHYLPDLNNERNPSDARKQRITSLKGFMLVMFTEDSMIAPKETAWFQQEDAQGNIMALEDSDFYRNDILGIRFLKEHGKLTFVEIAGEHLRFTEEDITNYFIPFLSD